MSFRRWDTLTIKPSKSAIPAFISLAVKPRSDNPRLAALESSSALAKLRCNMRMPNTSSSILLSSCSAANFNADKFSTVKPVCLFRAFKLSAPAIVPLTKFTAEKAPIVIPNAPNNPRAVCSIGVKAPKAVVELFICSPTLLCASAHCRLESVVRFIAAM